MIGLVWTRKWVSYKRGAIQIMVGRPRKKANREPNGRAVRVYVNPKEQAASQPHRVVVPMKYRERPEAESEFGRLMLNGHITPAQHEAGTKYAELAAQYRAVLSAPPIHPTGIDLCGGNGGGGEMPTHVARAIKARYDKAFEACAEAGNRALRAVKDHAVFERKIGDFETLTQLKRGLDKLVDHFGIDRRLQISHRH